MAPTPDTAMPAIPSMQTDLFSLLDSTATLLEEKKEIQTSINEGIGEFCETYDIKAKSVRPVIRAFMLLREGSTDGIADKDADKLMDILATKSPLAQAAGLG